MSHRITSSKLRARYGTIVLFAASLVSPVASATLGAEPSKATRQTWPFESDEPGKIAKGFPAEVGVWEVARDGGNHVLFQKAKNDNATFNVALVRGTRFKDVDLSVRLKAVAGEVDRGGGLVWRATGRDNY